MPGLSFLLLKPWHPSNKTNQKKIWIAEQQAKERDKREKEAAEELHREAEKQALEAHIDMPRNATADALQFMYKPPPGFKEAAEELADPTEDDAVREFRRRATAKMKEDPNFSANAKQSALERDVGRRNRPGMTLHEQVERFPFLKDAPVEGDYAKNVKLNFKPVGVAVRNVRCMRCGEWGHKSGDRECPMANFNPHDQARQRREDPLNYMKESIHADKQRLVLKKAALPREMNNTTAANESFELVASDDEEIDPEEEFLASLTTKEKKLLLRKLSELDKQGGGSGGDPMAILDSMSAADLTSKQLQPSKRLSSKQQTGSRDAREKKRKKASDSQKSRKKHKKNCGGDDGDESSDSSSSSSSS